MDGETDGRTVYTIRILTGSFAPGMEDPRCLRLGVPKSRCWDKNLSTSQFIETVKQGRITRMGKRYREKREREGKEA